MPVQECSLEGKPGYQWGDGGKCYTYTPGDEESRKDAKRKAYVQGYAIGELSEMEIEEYQLNDLSELADILNVPVLTTGEFQGHKGPPVIVDEARLNTIIQGSNLLQPVLMSALETGEIDGNPDALQRINKPLPARMTLNHQVLENDKIKEALKTVQVQFSKGEIDGKPWILGHYKNVPAVLADVIRRFFTKRSVELLNLKDPQTQITWPAIISTAFLDKATPPAVPGQSDDLLVEFAGLDESHYVITTDEPLILQGVTNMAEKKQEQDKSVDVSELQQMQETLTAQTKALAELQAEVAKSKEDREKAIELAKRQEAENKSLKDDVAELRGDNLIKALSRNRKKESGLIYQVKPAYLDIVSPIIKENGVVELAEGQSQQDAMYKIFDEIAELGDVTIQLSLEDEKSYSQEGDKANKNTTDVANELMAENPELSETDAFVEALNRRYANRRVD